MPLIVVDPRPVADAARGTKERRFVESVDVVHVPFNGAGMLMNALVGNQVSSAIGTQVNQIELARGGNTRILATSGGAARLLLPEVPTFAESGFRGD